MNVLSWYLLGMAIGLAANYLFQYIGLEPASSPVVSAIGVGCVLAFWRLSQVDK